MLRTQISLTESQMARLRAEALRRGVSMARLIREAVDSNLPAEEWEERKRRVLSYVGCVENDPDNVGEDHDRYLDEIYADW